MMPPRSLGPPHSEARAVSGLGLERDEVQRLRQTWLPGLSFLIWKVRVVTLPPEGHLKLHHTE